MKRFWCPILLALILFGLSCLLSAVREQVFAQVPMGAAAQVVVQPEKPAQKHFVDFTPIVDPTNPGKQLKAITVVDLESKTILVYHGDLALGEVKLLSTRDIRPDIMLGEFNAVTPTPGEIEAAIRRLNKSK